MIFLSLFFCIYFSAFATIREMSDAKDFYPANESGIFFFASNNFVSSLEKKYKSEGQVYIMPVSALEQKRLSKGQSIQMVEMTLGNVQNFTIGSDVKVAMGYSGAYDTYEPGPDITRVTLALTKYSIGDDLPRGFGYVGKSRVFEPSQLKEIIFAKVSNEAPVRKLLDIDSKYQLEMAKIGKSIVYRYFTEKEKGQTASFMVVHDGNKLPIDSINRFKLFYGVWEKGKKIIPSYESDEDCISVLFFTETDIDVLKFTCMERLLKEKRKASEFKLDDETCNYSAEFPFVPCPPEKNQSYN